jgi:hypothetical protein
MGQGCSADTFCCCLAPDRFRVLCRGVFAASTAPGWPPECIRGVLQKRSASAWPRVVCRRGWLQQRSQVVLPAGEQEEEVTQGLVSPVFTEVRWKNLSRIDVPPSTASTTWGLVVLTGLYGSADVSARISKSTASATWGLVVLTGLCGSADVSALGKIRTSLCASKRSARKLSCVRCVVPEHLSGSPPWVAAFSLDDVPGPRALILWSLTLSSAWSQRTVQVSHVPESISGEADYPICRRGEQIYSSPCALLCASLL